MSEWKPGDVALVEAGCWANRKIALRLHEGWSHTNGVSLDSEGVVSPARRLVVLDPESDEDMERLAGALLKAELTGSGELPEKPMTAAALRVRAALRELANPTPPRIDEPGVWGVVEASCVHSEERFHWMRHGDGNWWPFAEYGEAERRPLPDDWDSLIDPVLVREGVSD